MSESFKTWMQASEAWKHPYDVKLPPILYHVTPAGHEISKKGFIPGDKSGAATLGGFTGGGVCFTDNHEMAEHYRDGMHAVMVAAQGHIDVNDMHALMEIGAHFNFTPAQVKQMRQEARRAGDPRGLDYFRHVAENPRTPQEGQEAKKKYSELVEKNNARELYAFFQQMAYAYKGGDQKRFPLFLTGGFPESLKNAREIYILQISTAPGNGKPGPQDYSYHAAENEWRIFDPQNFDMTTLKFLW